MEPRIYRIRIESELAPRWQAWFDGLNIVRQNGQTVLVGPVADQTALHGLLAKVRDLGLTLISVERYGADGTAPHGLEQIPC